jgi:hypothetical protein
MLNFGIQANRGDLGVGPDYEWPNAQCCSSWKSIFLKIKIIEMIGNQKLGLAMLRRSWFNLDLIWAIALVVTGFVALMV